MNTIVRPPTRPPDAEVTPWGPRRSTASLKRHSVRGAAVTGAAQFLRFGIRFGSTAVLARLLVPEEFGLVAMTTVVTGFIGLFTDAGLASATIQRETITQRQVSNLFWFNVAAGVILAGVVLAVAPLVGWFYDEPRLVGICSALAISFVFGGLTIQHHSLLRREMRFKVLAAIDLVTMVAATAVAVLMGLAGMGYWALVGLSVTSAIVPAFGVWLMMPWRPSAPRDLRSTVPLLRFGGDVLTFNVVNYFSRQADNLLIGWYWGAAALGLYDKAYSLLLLPIKQINSPLGAVATPALARTQSEPERCARFFLSSVQLVASTCLPIVVLIAMFAEEVVLLWLGPAWIECAHLFRLLAVAAAVGAINNPVGWLLIALGHTRKYRQLGLWSAAAIVGAFAVGLPFGGAGVALAYSVASAAIFLPTWFFALKGTPISLDQVLRTLLPPFGAVLPALALASVLHAQDFAFAGDWFAPALAAAAFCATYALVLLLGFKRWAFFRGILRDLRR